MTSKKPRIDTGPFSNFHTPRTSEEQMALVDDEDDYSYYEEEIVDEYN